MPTIQELVNNKKLPYADLCQAILDKFGVEKSLNWDSILPPRQQKDLFGGETLRIVCDHPTLTNQKDIRPIVHLTGSTSQLLFFYVQLKDERLPKVDVERITRKFIGGISAERYIIWFFGNKSHSMLKVVISGKEGKKIVLKTLALESGQWYKTYDFILNKVAEQFNTDGLFQKEKEPVLLWKALWTAFDISIVNKKFYLEIKQVFDALVKDNLSKAKGILTTDAERSQFAVRLIGRIIFCWFLKKKGIIKDDVLSSSAVKSNKQYYHSLLESLFFDVFNTPVQQRKKNIPKLIADYPFLNGGLFDDQPTDHRNDYRMIIDDEWFEIFFNQTLERYNFTVDENSSSSSEIAIDPEMLGRIFENLLAEQNPETGETARKSTGSFYTPREIVEYMVEESLIAYLCTKLGVDEHSTEGIVPDEQLTLAPIKKQPPVQLGIAMKNAPKREDVADYVHTYIMDDELKRYIEPLGKALDEIKVLDPACGSGAFPMGVLQKLVGLKHTLNDKKDLYDVKLTTIQNSIYGVDIQPMATELSRLRCWLSLIVDEDPKHIKPLPNLDFKFVTANSLIDLGYDKFLDRIEGIKRGLGEEAKIPAFELLLEKVSVMEALKKDYFQAGLKEKQKETIKKDFKKVQIEIFNTTNRLRKNYPEIISFLDNLVKWEPFDEAQVAPFFSKSWMFGVNGGFDIVIGNPPYLNVELVPSGIKELYRKTYTTIHKRYDVFGLFFEIGLLNFVTNGIITLIVPSQIMNNLSFSKLRDMILKNRWLHEVCYLGDKIFEAANNDVCIFILKKPSVNKIRLVNALKFDTKNINEVSINYFDKFNNIISVSSTSAGDAIFDKLFRPENSRIRQLFDVFQGIVTGNNDVFILDDVTIEENKIEKGLLHPVLHGRDFGKWLIRNTDRKIVYITSETPINKYPNTLKYLNQFKEVLSESKSSEEKTSEWYCLHRPREKSNLDYTPKIIVQGTRNPRIKTRIVATIDEIGIYGSQGMNFIIPLDKKDTHSIYYLIAVLNSKVINYLYQTKFLNVAIKAEFLKDTPLPTPNEDNLKKIIPLVKNILVKKSENLNTTDLENEIDVMVCRLYNLRYDEVKIFDPAFALSEEEYEKVVV